MSKRESGQPAADQNADDGLQEFANLWQQAPVTPPVAEAIRAQVGRQERRMRWYAWFEWLASLVVGVGGIYLMLNSEAGDALWRALLVIVLLACAMAFSVSNRRGVWEPLEESVRGYLDLARLRLVRKRRMLRFAWLFFIAELGIFAVWQWLSGYGWLEPIFAGDGRFAATWILVFALAMGGWSIWYWHRIKSGEQQIAKWQRENIEATEK
ncbi:hypothetical protein [uncultured Microbulbifer sp.]|uniref:hypothetical protein n=1 Tax=uncultured Microbulbifer sp. TaxID=348147 RepID=UPI00260300F3|nr:hypothetical protein [uncultured Microbulbifer sp.]